MSRPDERSCFSMYVLLMCTDVPVCFNALSPVCTKRFQVCCTRSIFGEGFGKAAGRQPYSVRMTCSSEVLFITKQSFDDFFSIPSRKRQELKKDLFAKMAALEQGRQSWITLAVRPPRFYCYNILFVFLFTGV